MVSEETIEETHKFGWPPYKDTTTSEPRVDCLTPTIADSEDVGVPRVELGPCDAAPPSHHLPPQANGTQAAPAPGSTKAFGNESAWSCVCVYSRFVSYLVEGQPKMYLQITRSAKIQTSQVQN